MYIGNYIRKKGKIPLFIRESTPKVARGFISGILDLLIKNDPTDDRFLYFGTNYSETHFRRYLFNILRLFNVVPVKSYLSQSHSGPCHVNSFVRVSDLKSFNMCFYWLEKRKLTEGKPCKTTGYLKVRFVCDLLEESLLLKPIKSHWSIIADLTPLQPHQV